VVPVPLKIGIVSIVVCFFFSLVGTPVLYGMDNINAFVSIPPQAYFIREIGGDRVNVHIMIHPGDDPHTYEPKPGQMASFAQSHLYFAIDLPFEKRLLAKALSLNPSLRIIDTYKEIDQMPGDLHDPHIWLAPSLVKIQGRAIRDAFIEVDSQHADEYKKNYIQFCRKVDDVDSTIRSLLSHTMKKDFIVVHPSWSYFAREYDLNQLSMEVEGKEPKASDLVSLITLMREKQINTIFVSPQYSKKMAENLARETKAIIRVIDPLAEDWEKNMLETAQAIGESLK
jgi:zinc transport system substrate-binding protein